MKAEHFKDFSSRYLKSSETYKSFIIGSNSEGIYPELKFESFIYSTRIEGCFHIGLNNKEFVYGHYKFLSLSWVHSPKGYSLVKTFDDIRSLAYEVRKNVVESSVYRHYESFFNAILTCKDDEVTLRKIIDHVKDKNWSSSYFIKNQKVINPAELIEEAPLVPNPVDRYAWCDKL